MPALSAVVVPTNGRELDAITGNLAVWAHPGHAPWLNPPSAAPRLVFAFNNDPGPSARQEIEERYEANRLSSSFGDLDLISLDLEGERDTYERDYSRPVGTGGYKAGPNNQFMLIMDVAKEYGRCSFLMETDCAPIRPGWLERLTVLCEQPTSFWIMGSAYRGIDKLDPRFARHINGNAVYAAGDAGFQEFLRTFWRPRLVQAVQSEDRRLAYDCVLERSFSFAEHWPVWQANAHRFQYTEFIQNLSAARDLEEDGAPLVARILAGSTDTFVVHNANAARFLRERYGTVRVV